jgi:putative hydrolase of the HAD superfamily
VRRAIIFDGDDTLWETERLYDKARARCRGIVEGAGLNGEAWEARERLLDVDNVARLGHTLERFPTSCVEAYRAVCVAAEVGVEEAVAREVDGAARQVFEWPAPLMDKARETLVELRARGYALALLTKGDPTVQARRIESSGLVDLFDAIEIVDEKTPEVIVSLLHRLGTSPSDALTVGNSVRSDVLPSLAAGVTPVWIDAHVWEYEREHEPFPADCVIERKELEDLLEISSA